MLGRMFEVVPQPEFEAWYEQLPEPLAEEVTAAIDLVASGGEAADPNRLSRLLLWYEAPSSRGVSALVTPFGQLAASSARSRSYLEWHHEVLRCLQSPVFEERLAQLEGARAAQVLSEVERLKRRLHAERASGFYAPWAAAASKSSDESGVRQSFVELLSLVGLDPALGLGPAYGLRELRIDQVSPRLRVLFGLDLPRRRLIALLGESLDRVYYGDSVRRAEQAFRRYLEANAGEAGVAAP